MSFYDQEILRSITNNLSEDKAAYRKFFNSALKKFGVSSPIELSDEKKKDFFNYIDNNYDAKNEDISKDARTLEVISSKALLSENPGAMAAAAMATVTLKNAQGKEIKGTSALNSKDPSVQKKAKSMFQRLKDKFKAKFKKKDEPKKAAPKKQSKSDADFWKRQLGVSESAPEGWEGTVKAMKDESGIDNPYALAHWMKNKGYKSHKKECIEILTKLKERAQNRNSLKEVAMPLGDTLERALGDVGYLIDVVKGDQAEDAFSHPVRSSKFLNISLKALEKVK